MQKCHSNLNKGDRPNETPAGCKMYLRPLDSALYTENVSERIFLLDQNAVRSLSQTLWKGQYK